MKTLNLIIETVKNISPLLSIEMNENTLIKNVGLDSIEFISLLLSIEEAFGFEFPDDLLSLDNFTTIGDLVAIVEKLR